MKQTYRQQLAEQERIEREELDNLELEAYLAEYDYIARQEAIDAQLEGDR